MNLLGFLDGPEPVEVTWNPDGTIEMVFGVGTEWWDTPFGRRVRTWGHA